LPHWGWMLLIALLITQAAPDLEVHVRASAREVRIERSGETSLNVRAEPDAGSTVHVVKPPARGRRGRLRNVTVEVNAEARIADRGATAPPPETASPNLD
jgi:hypothetical protein